MSLQPDSVIPVMGSFPMMSGRPSTVRFSSGGMSAGIFCRRRLQMTVLARILTAAHHAGSVGFMQPWDFVVVRQRATKTRGEATLSEDECPGGHAL